MVTLNKIASDIIELATSGQENYSFSISYEQICYWIHQIRSQLITQALNKKEDITDAWLQVIKCLELEIIDSAECCEETTNCKILRSKKQLPVTIECKKDNMIVKVTTLNGDIISRSTSFEATYNKYNKYTGNKPNWYLRNNYLYITNDLDLEKVNIWGLFEDPTELSNFINCDKDTCYSDDGYYPVTLKMASDITNIIFQTKIQPFLSIPKDKDNDSDDEVKLTK